EKLSKDLVAEKDQHQKDLAEQKQEVKKKQQRLASAMDAVNKLVGEFSVNTKPSGKVVWVNQRRSTAADPAHGVVYINLGGDDMLRPRITFTIYDQSVTDPSAVPTAVGEKSEEIRRLPGTLQKNLKEDQSAAETAAAPELKVAVSEAKSKGVIEVL